jgi:protein tyrosine/serine phosphatase
MNKKRELRIMKRTVTICIIVVAMSYTAFADETSLMDRPAHWAKPIRMEGVPNLHKVSDTLYRSAQPSAEGMRNLKAMGIETIVNLRSFHSDRDEIGNTGLAYEHMYMKAWHPEEEELVRFFQIVTDPKRTPVLVHCQHGADRTGTMCTLYRIVIQGWSKEEAIKEMTQGGFGFHEIWDNLIEWINALDIESIKKQAGIE